MHSIVENSLNNNIKKSEKKFKCPYCDERIYRSKLAKHVSKKHEDMIPEGYTAGRVAFNAINKKEVGHCIICHGETDWNEDKQRYERLCNKKSCHDKYVKMAEERLKKARGVTKQELLSDPEFQNKMLNNRSISGKYKMSDGGIKTYVGSYELDFLKFLDGFLNVKSEDLESPGPTIEYYYEGKKHFWILDYLYTPYNLAIDIKDGGTNPNTRSMPEYRAKQDAKEKAISQQVQYNYIRLTDKNYTQLIDMMIKLKESYIDFDADNFKPLIQINESHMIKESALTDFDIQYLQKYVL